MIKITLLYDNDINAAGSDRLQADWGFAALIEASDHTILFDTGARGDVLMNNMSVLNIAPQSIDEIFISHDHWDHTGGLDALTAYRPAHIYVPGGFATPLPEMQAVVVDTVDKIHENIYSTGTLDNIEQSLCLIKNGQVIVVAGCSHPDVEPILKAASQFGPVTALIGGLHGFDDFAVLNSLELICATHCTQYKQEILDRFPNTAIPGGVGKILQL